MRVLVAPDKFAGTLTAPEAAAAIVAGWRRARPGDDLVEVPMADGGPGFVDVLHAALGGRLRVGSVTGPLGDPVPITTLHVGRTAYVEAAQACGLSLGAGRPLRATTRGVGEAVAAAVADGATEVVIGLGGTATTDGGAGALAGLGAIADVPLDLGPDGLAGIGSMDLTAPRRLLAGVRLVAAADVDIALLGMFGAAKTFGPQKGLDDAQVLRVDGILDDLVVAACGPTPAERRVAEAPGAGAAGGLGFALLLLGAEVAPGVGLVARATGLGEVARSADLVVTGEGAYDFSSRAGKVVFGVAAVAAERARACVVIAGRVDVGSREMRAMGVESAYALTDLVGAETALARPAESLSAVAERVAVTWSRE